VAIIGIVIGALVVGAVLYFGYTGGTVSEGDIESFDVSSDLWFSFEFEDEISKKDLEKFLKLLSPFCPHVAEELWEKIGNKGFLSLESWPKIEEKKIDDKFEKAEEFTEKVVSDISNILKIVKGEKIYLYVIPNEVEMLDSKELSKKIGKEVVVYNVNDSKKHDPKGKAKKAKPGKPGIYVE